MRFGALGIIWSDWSDVTYESVAVARELGFRGIGAHLTVPASTIGEAVAANVRACIAGNDLEFIQLWGPYPSIISPDEEVRRAGVEGARDVVRLAARLGVREAGVRPTSHNPRGDWWPHPENHSQASEDRLVRSLEEEVVEVAAELGVTVVLEAHATSTLDSPPAHQAGHRADGSGLGDGQHRPLQLRARPAHRLRPDVDDRGVLSTSAATTAPRCRSRTTTWRTASSSTSARPSRVQG